METLTVEIINPTAFALLKDLELLKVLKIVENPSIENKTKLSEKYKGVFSKSDSESFEKHVNKSRNEWSNT